MDYTASILDYYGKATDADIAAGTEWYATALATAERLAIAGGITTDTAARIIAVLSPRKRWWQNIVAAECIIEAFRNGQDMPYIAGTLGANVRKAWDIVHGNPDALRGQKVTRFYQNILGIETEVTVDVWAMRAAGVWDHDAPTTTEYREIAAAYVAAAAVAKVSPSALQAIVWTVVRGKAD